jgi:hypothetical protein
MRYWRSHLLLSHRIPGPNIYGIDPHEANVAHHRDRTIIGANEENTPCAEPSTDIDAEEVSAMKKALGRFMKIGGIERLSAIACMKVDVANDKRKLRNLDVEIVEALPNVICAFPGKMTEAPFLADAVTHEIISRNDHLRVKRRPIDEAAL